MNEPDVWKREWAYRYKFRNRKHIKNKALGGMKSPRKRVYGLRGKTIHDGTLETPALVGRHARRNQ